MLSVICPVYNEEKYIIKCIDSILDQDYSKNDLEVFFVDGMSTDNTRLIINQYIDKYPFIHLLDNPHKIVPYAMNLGIKHSKGDVIIRLDAHALYPSNYFSKLLNGLKKYNADNVGGICKTLPTDTSSKAIAIAEALSSPLGVGNSMFRIGAEHDIEVDTVPFGCFKREIFDKIGLYDVELIRNQDDELNARIIQAGGKIVLLSDITISYFARDSYNKLYKMYYQYGLYKPLVNRKLGSPATIRQFIPPLFVLYLILGLIFSCIIPYLWIIYIIPLLIYILLNGLFATILAKKHKRLGLTIHVPFAIFTIHFGYGIGYWYGLYKILFKQSFNAEVNR